jgi:hypothetical protein
MDKWRDRKWHDSVVVTVSVIVLTVFCLALVSNQAIADDNAASKIKSTKKTASFFQQQEKKKLFILAKLYSKKGDEFLKASAKFSSNPKVRKKQINGWMSNFYKLYSPEMKSINSGNYQLVFVEEWKILVDIHTQWIHLVEATEQERQPASVNSIKLLITKTENFKKRAAKLTVW